MSKPTGDATARYERLSHSGTTWFDLMPTPANGTDGGTIAWPVFDGASFVTIGQPVKLDFAGAFSISFWVKQSINAPAGWERVVARDAGGTDRCYIANEVDTAGPNNTQFAAFLWRTVGGLSSTTTGNFADDAWHYTTYVNAGTGGDLIVYVNGSEAARAVGGGGIMDLKAVDLFFGKDAAGSSTFQGSLDTVRFYSRALSPDEIVRDYHAGKPAHQ